MSPKQKSILIVVSFLLAGSLGYFVSRFWVSWTDWNEFHKEKDEIRKILDELAETPPKGVSKEAWEALCSFGEKGVANALFTPAYAPISEVIRLKKDFRQKLDSQTEVTPVIMVWFWERLGQCSDKSRRMAEKLRPLFNDYLAVVQKEYEKQDK